MFELKIDSFYKAHELMDAKWPTKSISLIAPDEDRCFNRGMNHLLLRFDDSDIENDEEMFQSIKGWRQVQSPRKQQVAIALAFTKDLKDGDRLLVHCTAGKSRSTAIGIAALIQHGMTPQEAFDHVKALRPALIPNRLIIQYVDELLELNGELNKVIEEYYNSLLLDSKLPLLLLRRHKIEK